MRFGDLRRMALDIEVVTGGQGEFPNAAREADRIVAVALADSTGFTHVVRGDRLDEPALLEETTRLIRERDPDVIEGHNIFRFDLEYLEARARRHRVRLAWGRDGTELRGRPARLQVAERSIGYRRYEIGGRHVVDTWMLAQLHDVGARDLPSFGLKDIARHLGVAAADRTYLDASRHRPRAGRGARPPHGLRCRRRRGDPGHRRHPGSALLRAGPAAAVRLPGRHPARRRGQDRRSAGARVPAPWSRHPHARRQPVGRRRPDGDLAPGRGGPGAARRRDLALSLADAGREGGAGLGRARRVPRTARSPARRAGDGQAAGPHGGRAGGAAPSARAAADLQDPHQRLLRLPGLRQRTLQRLRRGRPGHHRGPPHRHRHRRPAHRARRHAHRGRHRRRVLPGPRRPRRHRRRRPAGDHRGRPARGHRAGARRPPGRDAVLQDEDLRAARRPGPRAAQGLGLPLAGAGAVPAPGHRGDRAPAAGGAPGRGPGGHRSLAGRFRHP